MLEGIEIYLNLTSNWFDDIWDLFFILDIVIEFFYLNLFLILNFFDIKITRFDFPIVFYSIITLFILIRK